VVRCCVKLLTGMKCVICFTANCYFYVPETVAIGQSVEGKREKG